MYKYLIVLACLIFIVNCEITITGNATLTQQQSGEWAFRSTSMTGWNLGLWSGMFYHSAKAGGNGQGQGGADALWGAAYTGSLTHFPTAWLATFSADWNFNGVTDWATADVSTSGSFIGSAFLRLVEKTPDGTTAKETLLKNLVWTTESSSTTGDLKYISFKGQSILPGVTIHIHFMLSSVLAKVDLADAIVSPKTLESVIEIAYDYKNAANTLTLDIGAASGAGTVSGSAYIIGQGEDKIYFSAAKQAMIGGKLQDVKFSAFAAGTMDATFGNNDLKGQIQAKYGATAEVKVLSITFPAGQSPIQYDPTIGQGEILDQGAAAVIVPTFLFLLVAILLNLM